MAIDESSRLQRVNVMGVGINVLNLQTAYEAVRDRILSGNKGYVTVTGAHGVVESQNDPEFRRILNDSFLTTPDGMPLVWMGKIAGFKHMDRVYGPDLMLHLCDLGRQHEWKHYFYGGVDGVAGELKMRLEQRFPGLKVVGTDTPPFRPLNAEEQNQLAQRIAVVKPDLFWVGLSSPKQERFMVQYLDKLDAKIMFGVGAAFDFHSGRVRQAPRWIQRSGFEWLFRLCSDWRRLWKRYLNIIPRFLLGAFLQLTRLKKFPYP